jgi:hypothetical protein
MRHLIGDIGVKGPHDQIDILARTGIKIPARLGMLAFKILLHDLGRVMLRVNGN